MARYTDSVCKQCRREGMKLFLKGERCLGPKCAVEKRAYAPGMHGQKTQFRQRQSDYGMQLREKQRTRHIYGVLERQFRRYFEIALKQRGQTGANLLIILESRMDNLVYRFGFADSRAQARALVTQGHFDLNGHRMDIPSALLKPGDIVTVHETSRQNGYFKGLGEVLEQRELVNWLSMSPQTLTGTVIALPTREQIDVPIQEQLIVEYYSR
ncbi:MAG: 30S ribosomal protein S4 [Anaerolineae bacterium]